MTKINAAASAYEVRSFFVENPKMVPAGDKTVGRNPGEHRGRLSVAAREVFTEATGKTYVTGTAGVKPEKMISLSFTYTQPSGKKVNKTETLSLSEVRSLAGDAAKGNGRLSAKAIEAAANARGEQMTKAGKAKKAAAKPKKATAAAVTPEPETVVTDSE